MRVIEVFADVACPFAHAGLRAFVARRRAHDLTEPRLHVRAWPLELVNGTPHSGSHLEPEIVALRAKAAPDLFAGFAPDRFPTSSLAAMASAAAANRVSRPHGEAFSLAVRDALWEHGLDVSDPDVLAALRADLDIPAPTPEDEASVQADLEEGRRRGVTGSPHFFTDAGDFFCPALEIRKDGNHYDVSVDTEGFERFVAAAFA